MFYTMALIRVLIFFLISVLGILPINAVEYILRPSETVHLLSNFQNDVFTNSSLSAPFYRGVVTGAAWAMPASAFDLGGRSMTCECFDPDGMILITR